ncbi:unnamed protein product, partial [Ectocarpus fasciculatus]
MTSLGRTLSGGESGNESGSEYEDTTASSTSDIEHGDVPLADATSESGASENEANDNDTSPNVLPGTASVDRERGDTNKPTHGKHGGEKEDDDEEG